jgi:hypothetical protein
MAIPTVPTLIKVLIRYEDLHKSFPILFGTTILRPGCIKRCQVVVKVNIMSSDLIGGYLTFYLNQPIKWADFRLDALLADTMLTKLYTTGPYIIFNFVTIFFSIVWFLQHCHYFFFYRLVFATSRNPWLATDLSFFNLLF